MLQFKGCDCLNVLLVSTLVIYQEILGSIPGISTLDIFLSRLDLKCCQTSRIKIFRRYFVESGHEVLGSIPGISTLDIFSQ